MYNVRFGSFFRMQVHQTDSSDRTLLLYKNYSRNYHAVVVMWAIFSMCFVVIDVIAFAQPQWIGDTDDSLGVGYFGLLEFCELFSSGQELVCTGSLREFGDIISVPFKAATVLVGLSCLLMMICVLCFLLFFCIKKQFVLIICGCIQLLAGKPISSRIYRYGIPKISKILVKGEGSAKEKHLTIL